MDNKIKISLIGGIILLLVCFCCLISIIVGMYFYSQSGNSDTATNDGTTNTTGTTDNGTKDSGTTNNGTKDSGTTDNGTGTTDNGTKETDNTDPNPTPTPTPTTEKEVYHVQCTGSSSYCMTFSDAQAVANKFGGSIASESQLMASYNNGANWCSTGWVSSGKCMYPITTQVRMGCGNGSAGVTTYMPSGQKCGVNVYGVKPTMDKATSISGYKVIPFDEFRWSQYTITYEKPEVFHVQCSGSNSYCVSQSEAETVAKKFNGTVATIDQLNDVQISGADWCSTGWLANGECGYPITTSTQAGCGNGSAGVKIWKPSTNKCGINIYAVKPTKDKATTAVSGYKVLPFNTLKWSRWD
jgi:hypothetical protein